MKNKRAYCDAYRGLKVIFLGNEKEGLRLRAKKDSGCTELVPSARSSTAPLCISRDKMNKYEYKVLSTKEILDAQILKTEGKFKLGFKSPKDTRSLINSYLNTLGDDGWELVSIRARSFLGCWNGDDYFLKRQKNA